MTSVRASSWTSVDVRRRLSHGVEGLDSDVFFKYKRQDNGTRGHSWALVKERCKLDIRKYSFPQRTTSAVLRLECSLDCLSAPTLWRYDVAV